MRKVTAVLLAAAATASLPAIAAAQRSDRDGQQRQHDQASPVQADRGHWQQRAPMARPEQSAPRPVQSMPRPDQAIPQRPQGLERPQGRPQWQGQTMPNRGVQGEARWQGQPGQPQRDGNWSRGDRGRDANPAEQVRRGDDRPDRFRGDDRRPDARPDDRPDMRPGGDHRPDFRPGGDRRPDFQSGRGDWQRDRGDWRGRPDFRGDHGGNGRFDRGWRQDRRFDWRGYRDQHRSLFRGPRYVAPRGWGYGYRRFEIGVRLPSFFFAEQYWLDDPWEYRLPPAYGPYRWVRYYNDVLLVDMTTGMVVDSIPDFFL